jgi:cytochrome c biogenesis factor
MNSIVYITHFYKIINISLKKYFFEFFNIVLVIILIKFVLFYTCKNNMNYILDIKFLKNNNNVWQSLFYLNNNNNSIFLFTTIYILINFYKKFKINCILVFFTLMLYFLINLNLNNYNLYFYELICNNNTPLFNGVLLIHPYCIYITYVLFIIFFKKKGFSNIFFSRIFSKKILVFSITAVFLGSYWAQQELNWGGWWNWDYVELIAFIFFLFSLFFTHIFDYKNNFFLKVFYKLNLYWYFLIFFILVRCDILSSIHSFNSFNFLDRYLYYICVLFILTIYFLKNKKNSFIYFYLIFKNHNHQIGFIFLIFITSTVVFMMYNIVLFFYTNTQFISSFFFLKLLLNLVLFFSAFSFFKKTNLILSLILIFFLKNIALVGVVLILFYFLKSLKNKYVIIHAIILVFTLFCNNYNYIFTDFNSYTNLNIKYVYNTFSLQNTSNLFYKNNLFFNFLNEMSLSVIDNSLPKGFFNSLNTNNITELGNILYFLDNSNISVFYKNLTVMYFIFIIFIICFYIDDIVFIKVV